jgi:hypothetical protein
MRAVWRHPSRIYTSRIPEANEKKFSRMPLVAIEDEVKEQ